MTHCKATQEFGILCWQRYRPVSHNPQGDKTSGHSEGRFPNHSKDQIQMLPEKDLTTLEVFGVVRAQIIIHYGWMDGKRCGWIVGHTLTVGIIATAEYQLEGAEVERTTTTTTCTFQDPKEAHG